MKTIIVLILKTLGEILMDWFKEQQALTNEWNAKMGEARIRGVEAANERANAVRAARDDAANKPVRSFEDLRVFNASRRSSAATGLSIMAASILLCGCFTRYVYVERPMIELNVTELPTPPDREPTEFELELIEAAVSNVREMDAYNDQASAHNDEHGFVSP